MGHGTRLQYKTLKARGKIRGRKSNEEQWRKQWKTMPEAMKSVA
jgi:hypothetical protein